MDKSAGPNVPDPAQFGKALQEMLNAIHKLLDATKEYDWKPVTEDGVRAYYEEEGKCGFQAACQYERPSEFLQCLLDIIRVHFEPRPMGTLFLNSNLGFLFEELPEESFQLALHQINKPSSVAILILRVPISTVCTPSKDVLPRTVGCESGGRAGFTLRG